MSRTGCVEGRAKTLTREQIFAENLKEEIFQLTDVIGLCDTQVSAYHAHWISQLFCHNLGPFYVADALRLAPRLQEDEVPSEYFIEAVEREIMDPEANWRMNALQQAQRESRQRLGQIEWRLQGVEKCIEEIP